MSSRRTLDQAPALMTGSEIYETFFGLDRLYPDQLGEDLRRYGYLAGDPARTDDEERELHHLFAAHAYDALSVEADATEIRIYFLPRKKGKALVSHDIVVLDNGRGMSGDKNSIGS